MSFVCAAVVGNLMVDECQGDNDDLEEPEERVNDDKDVAKARKEGLSVEIFTVILLGPEEDDERKHGETNVEAELINHVRDAVVDMGDGEAPIDDASDAKDDHQG